MLLSVVFLLRVDSCDQTADGDDAMFQVEVSLAVARARCRQTAPTASGGCGTVAHWHNSASKRSIRRFVITEKAPPRAFSWLKAATTAFTFKVIWDGRFG